MGRPSDARVEAGFDFVCAVRHIERHWDEYRDPAFWTRLNPHLTVSANPFSADRADVPALTPDVVSRALTQLDASGFIATPPLVPDSRMAPIRRAMTSTTSVSRDSTRCLIPCWAKGTAGWRMGSGRFVCPPVIRRSAD